MSDLDRHRLRKNYLHQYIKCIIIHSDADTISAAIPAAVFNARFI